MKTYNIITEGVVNAESREEAIRIFMKELSEEGTHDLMFDVVEMKDGV